MGASGNSMPRAWGNAFHDLLGGSLASRLSLRFYRGYRVYKMGINGAIKGYRKITWLGSGHMGFRVWHSGWD